MVQLFTSLLDFLSYNKNNFHFITFVLHVFAIFSLWDVLPRTMGKPGEKRRKCHSKNILSIVMSEKVL